MPDLKTTFKTTVVDRLKSMSLRDMHYNFTPVLQDFLNSPVLSKVDCDDLTTTSLGFENTAMRPLMINFRDTTNPVWYRNSASAERWSVLPIRELSMCERALSSVRGGLSSLADVVTVADVETGQQISNPFLDAAAYARSTRVGLGLGNMSMVCDHQAPYRPYLTRCLDHMALVRF